MADELQTNPELEQESAATATAEAEGDEKPSRLNQTVDIKDAGACRKHIKVAIPQDDLTGRLNDKFKEMVDDAEVPGYRPGKAPRKLIERRFFREVSDRLKAELLMQSLEQVAEDHKIIPISQPNIDPFKIEFPKEGPLEYEFDVEVAPEFELPNYKGLRLTRPTHEFTEEEITKARDRFLGNYGTLVPKDEAVEINDFIICDVTTKVAGQQIGKLKEITLRVQPQLAFKDGMVPDFGDKIKGAKAGETRNVEISLSDNVSNPGLRGITADMVVEVKDVKRLRLPEVDENFLSRFGLNTPEQLREKVLVSLKRQLEHEQRRSARDQVLQKIAGASEWDLPPDLLRRQAQKAFQRQILDMRSAGYSEEAIRAKANLLQQNALENSAKALKEHFVLQKVAEVEKIEVEKDDIEFEIEMMATQTDETPRRVRARLEKEDMMEALAGQIIERKSLDLILNNAEYEDVPWKQEESKTEGVEAQVTPEEKKTEENVEGAADA